LTPDAPNFAPLRVPPSRRALLAEACSVFFLLLGHPALADSVKFARFEIPAQPIPDALDAYSAITGFDVFYDGALAAGRRSNPVEGVLSPDIALRQLLAGTGLAARATAKGSFTLGPAETSRVGKTSYQSYFATLQSKVAQALCGRAETRPGDRDVVIRIWIAAAGTVQQARTVEMPDVAAKEEPLATALRGLPIGAPPAGMPQPVTMAILARNANAPSGCADAVTGVR
jgi:hypothetical protein